MSWLNRLAVVALALARARQRHRSTGRSSQRLSDKDWVLEWRLVVARGEEADHRANRLATGVAGLGALVLGITLAFFALGTATVFDATSAETQALEWCLRANESPELSQGLRKTMCDQTDIGVRAADDSRRLGLRMTRISFNAAVLTLLLGLLALRLGRRARYLEDARTNLLRVERAEELRRLRGRIDKTPS